MLDVTDEVERVVDRNADDDARYANDYHRDAVVHKSHAAKRKEPASKDGQGDEQDVPEPAESIKQQG